MHPPSAASLRIKLRRVERLRCAGDHITILISHRLSTVRKADRIYVLERGWLVESGTYRELMQRRGVFAALARRQVA